MDVLGLMERDVGVDDNEVVADSKEEEQVVMELEGDIITSLEKHQGISAEVVAAEAQNKSNSRLVLEEVANVDSRVLLEEVAVEKSVAKSKKEREGPWETVTEIKDNLRVLMEEVAMDKVHGGEQE